MKISIAMATYNGAQHLNEQLNSFLLQKRLPDEVIITDDGSCDKTEEIVKSFSKRAPFNVFFSQNTENLGYCGNFNQALSKTTGDLIFLSDQDDFWYAEKIEYIEKTAAQNPNSLMIMNDAQITDENLNDVGITKIQQLVSGGYSMDNFVMGCCCALRRELLDLCLPIPDEFKAHDDWLVYFANGLNANTVEEKVLQSYRRHDHNESQFIANRKTSISKTDVLFQNIKVAFDKNREARDRQELNQLIHLRSGIQRALSKEKKEHSQKLKEMLNNTERKIVTSEERSKIRKLPFYFRIFRINKLILNGSYRISNGAKSIFRDLVG
ncbi:glycosyltransferase [Halomonadaceae bacterium KBTZ08]